MFFKPVREHVLSQVPYLSSELYSAIRVYLVILWSLSKLLATKQLLTVYLENAKDKAMLCSKHADGFEMVIDFKQFFAN